MTSQTEEEPGGPSGDRNEGAQELADRARVAHGKTKALLLARRALQLDAECTDAQIVIAQEEERVAKALASRLKSILDQAEARLGASFLQEHRGRLWEIPQARPGLRARMALAQVMEKSGKPRLAIRHLETLLAMDSQDHLGARFRLVCCLLMIKDLKGLAGPLKRWEGEDAAFVAWAALLERIHAKDELGAEKALARARQVNPHFEGYLTGRYRQPKHIPESSAPGSPEEAASCLLHLGETWVNDREGMYWLFTHS